MTWMGPSASSSSIDYSAPAGYVNAAEGLSGEPLRAALHLIINDHSVLSYDFAWTAFWMTDDKSNGSFDRPRHPRRLASSCLSGRR